MSDKRVWPCGHLLPRAVKGGADLRDVPDGVRVLDLIGIDARHWLLVGGWKRGDDLRIDQAQLGHWEGEWDGLCWDVREDAAHRMFDETWTIASGAA